MAAEHPSDELQAQFDFVKWGAQLRADLSQSVNGVLLRGARAVPVGSSASATKNATNNAGALVGFALRNTSASVSAVVLLRDGTTADAPVVVPITLAPDESIRDWFGPSGVNLSFGLYVDVTAGAVDGTVFLRGAE